MQRASLSIKKEEDQLRSAVQREVRLHKQTTLQGARGSQSVAWIGEAAVAFLFVMLAGFLAVRRYNPFGLFGTRPNSDSETSPMVAIADESSTPVLYDESVLDESNEDDLI
jgi:hypothetical protein